MIDWLTRLTNWHNWLTFYHSLTIIYLLINLLRRWLIVYFNRSFPIHCVSLFENVSSCKTFYIKLKLICVKMNQQGEPYFHINGFARRLSLTQRQRAARKWLVCKYKLSSASKTISFFFVSKPQNNKMVFQCKHGFQPNYVADANGQVHLVSQQENKAEQRSPCKSNLITCCMACTQSTESEKTDLSVLTNKCCRYMFPISFAIFNLVYWLALSTGN